jgi:Tfp pilus assembly protein PilN
MRAVNLLPYVEQPSSWRGSATSRLPVANPLWLSGGLAALLVASVAALFVLSSSTLAEKRDELQALEAEQAAIAPLAAQVQAKVIERKQREAALASALQNRVNWDRLLRRVSQVLPSEVVTTGLTAKTPTSAGTAEDAEAATTTPNAPGAAPTGFTLAGYGGSHAVVAQSLRRLAVIPELTNLQLVSSAKTELVGREVVQFTIAGEVTQRGAEQ